MTALHDSIQHRTLLDELLAEQRSLTAAERFSRRHERDELPRHSRLYRDLIPLDKPRAGQQYAFAVELDACTGCKACVSACHSLNGLDEDEIWRDVGFIHGENGSSYQQTVTTACHHCVEPGCLEGCPVAAYEKEEDTGIVRHLDDQCIGCQYCTLKCPYDVPKYSKRLGIVRKCDMCVNRLAEGEAPACVQACPTSAITIRLVDKEEMRAARNGSRLVPGAFESNYTKPTTTYRTARPQPSNTQPADAGTLRLEHAHWPLIAMLLLTQMAVGSYIALAFAWMKTSPVSGALAALLSIAGFVALNLGLGVSVLHLGRPLGAWRFFLGLRTSWMSREILVFSLLAGAAFACMAITVLPWIPSEILTVGERVIAPTWILAFSPWVVVVVGLLGVFCSAMIYVDTRRPFWAAGLTMPKFFGTTLLLGAIMAAAISAWAALPNADFWSYAQMFAAVAIAIRTALMAWEIGMFVRGLRAGDRSAATMWNLQRHLVLLRPALFAFATGAAFYALASDGVACAVSATLALIGTVASQTIERYFFFTAVVAPRMPGGVRA